MQVSTYRYLHLALWGRIYLPCALMTQSKQHISIYWCLGDLSEILKILFSKANCDANLISIFEKKKHAIVHTSSRKSTLFQALAWCCQPASYYANQIWPRSLSPYGATRPQWVNALKIRIDLCKHTVIHTEGLVRYSRSNWPEIDICIAWSRSERQL